MTSFLLFAVCVLLGGGADGIGEGESNHLSDDCLKDPLPSDIFEWKGSLILPWKTSNSFVCNSVNTCHGLHLSQDEALLQQMRPIAVMPHDDLRLEVSGQTGQNMTNIQTYLVDEEGFGSCDHSRGEQLGWSSSATDRTDQVLIVSVPHERLRLGPNFLIGIVPILHPANSTIPSQADDVLDCWNGLRLNITVKLNNCQTKSPSSAPNAPYPHGNGSFSCSKSGRCVTDLHSTTFYCRCCNESFDSENCLPSPSSSLSSSSSSSLTSSVSLATSTTPNLPSLLRSILLSVSSTSPYEVKMEQEQTSSSSSLSSSLSSLSSLSCKCKTNNGTSSEEKAEKCQCSQPPPDTQTAEASVTSAHLKPRCLPECSNGTQCVATDNGTHVCRCPDGRLDTDCGNGNVLDDVCTPNPCHHGICVIQPLGYLCYCIPGYGGRNCQTKYELMCSGDLCKNGGTCHEGDEPDTYRCDCPEGYGGQDCSTKSDLCLSNPCVHICLDYGANYICECNPGFTGHQCELNVNECDSNPCHNGGRCHDFVAGYRCQCAAGFHGTHCEHHTMSEMTLFVSSHRPHLHSLSMVAGTLAGAVLIAMSVVLGCYCKVNGIYRVFLFGKKGYRKQFEEEPIPSSSGSAFLGNDNPYRSTVEQMMDGSESCCEARRGGIWKGSRGDDLREIYLDVSPLVDSFRAA